jgi:hypothetical protein
MSDTQAAEPQTQKQGIKETQEAIVAANEIGLFVVSRVKDGLGVDDAAALVNKILKDEAFREVVHKAVENAGAIPAEVKDLDAMEGVALGTLQLSYVPKFIEALKK